MISATRRTFTISMLALLAACGRPKQDKPTFARYSGPPITQVSINKTERRMYLLNGTNVIKAYDVGLGNQPAGHKQFSGDGKTPEGVYHIDRFNPRSAYHLSVGISYPNDNDRMYAESLGRDPGGDIFIHGRGPLVNNLLPLPRDWTAGCIAVTDTEIEEIYAMLQPGVQVVIFP